MKPMISRLYKNKADLAWIYEAIPSQEHRLLARPIRVLTPTIDAAGFNAPIKKLHEELRSKHLTHVKIEAYFGDEWFCPAGSTAIAIPFWLANARLKRIEKKLMGHVEGGSADEFMRLLRHEAGHCIEHAYRLSKRRDWRIVFGNPNKTYNPDSVQTVSSHPDYVINLPGGYAQTHPEEDFAETFAVWLNPQERWKKFYSKFPVALQKILFVDNLMKEISVQQPKSVSTDMICNARRMRRTLASYYHQRIRSQNLN